MILKLRHLFAGQHVIVSVFVGPKDQTMTNVGTLTMLESEYVILAATLKAGVSPDGFETVVLEQAVTR